MSDQGLSLPDPMDHAREAVWNGEDFLVDGRRERILTYDVAPSGWTDELTHLHEETGGSDHFIDVASRAHAVAEVARCVLRDRSTIVEIGCSSGFLLADIRRRLPQHFLIGSDYTNGTLRALAPRAPGIPLIQFDLTRCPLPDDFADVFVLLNVLEHIDDHEAAIRHLFRVTRPGGVVIIEVPAGTSLFDVYDRVLMHHRRYDMASLVAALKQAGFAIERQSHLGFFLYPAFYLSKRLNQMRYPEGTDVQEQQIVASMIAATKKSSPLMGIIMKVEGALRPYIYYPFGIRCLVTCRKPQAR
jgi:SAM-dependent methyltransferase